MFADRLAGFRETQQSFVLDGFAADQVVAEFALDHLREHPLGEGKGDRIELRIELAARHAAEQAAMDCRRAFGMLERLLREALRFLAQAGVNGVDAGACAPAVRCPPDPR
jgi:hypothetical protein